MTKQSRPSDQTSKALSDVQENARTKGNEGDDGKENRSELTQQGARVRKRVHLFQPAKHYRMYQENAITTGNEGTRNDEENYKMK